VVKRADRDAWGAFGTLPVMRELEADVIVIGAAL